MHAAHGDIGSCLQARPSCPGSQVNIGWGLSRVLASRVAMNTSLMVHRHGCLHVCLVQAMNEVNLGQHEKHLKKAWTCWVREIQLLVRNAGFSWISRRDAQEHASQQSHWRTSQHDLRVFVARCMAVTNYSAVVHVAWHCLQLHCLCSLRCLRYLHCAFHTFTSFFHSMRCFRGVYNLHCLPSLLYLHCLPLPNRASSTDRAMYDWLVCNAVHMSRVAR